MGQSTKRTTCNPLTVAGQPGTLQKLTGLNGLTIAIIDLTPGTVNRLKEPGYQFMDYDNINRF